MEWKKVKWVIIFLLVAVDIFLMANIVFRYSKAYANEKEALQAAVSLAASSEGFSMEAFSKLPRYMYSFEGVRDTDAERELADSFASERVTTTDSGGGVHIYVGSSSERIVFRRGGNLTAIVGAKGAANAQVEKCAEKSNLTVYNDGHVINFLFKDRPITNAYMDAVTTGEYVSVSGRIPLCSKWQQADKGRSRGEMVIALHAAIENEELGALKSVEAVYYLESNGSMGLVLVPAWRAKCENGIVILSVMDKTVIQSEQ